MYAADGVARRPDKVVMLYVYDTWIDHEWLQRRRKDPYTEMCDEISNDRPSASP